MQMMGRFLILSSAILGLSLSSLSQSPVQETQPGLVFVASPLGRNRALELLDCQGGHHLRLALEKDTAAPADAERLDLAGERARTDRALATRVHQACCLELHGGHMNGWWRALFPREKRTALGRALHQSWRRGTPVIGSGAGAAMLGNGGPATKGDWPLAINDRKKDFDWGRALTGLGISPLPLLGASGQTETPLPADSPGDPEQPPAEGTPTQVLDAMERFGVEAGAWLEGQVTLAWHPQERTLKVHGPGRCHFLVLDGAHRAGHILGLLWELGDGAIWIPSREEIRTPLGDQPLKGIDEKRTLGHHLLLVRSIPPSRQHQRKGHLPTRTFLQAELIRTDGRGSDRRR